MYQILGGLAVASLEQNQEKAEQLRDEMREWGRSLPKNAVAAPNANYLLSKYMADCFDTIELRDSALTH